VSQLRVIRFLERHDFEHVPTKNGELSYRHRPTGQKVSVPKHREDIKAGTSNGICRRLSEIMNRDIRIVKGDLAIVGQNRRQATNGKVELKGGLD
jgi:predicted RNA binding protein YcfA (HicA-like mRNA interferase family)